jgi:hypothetical protein
MAGLFGVCFFLCLFVDTVFSQRTVAGSSFTIARLKYRGGGDWNNDPSEEVDLLTFVKQNVNIGLNPQYEFAEILSEDFFLYTFKTTRDRVSCEDRTRRSRWWHEAFRERMKPALPFGNRLFSLALDQGPVGVAM